MKIIYSPFYDGDTYLGDSTKVIGTTYVGNMGLLDQLQLRAGIHLATKSDVEREAEYHKVMMNHIPGTVFEQAAHVDPLGVAAKLLQWRDALIMAGWDGKCDDPNASKIDVLSSIEKDFKAMGFADCWRRISEVYDKSNYLNGCVEEIQVDCPWSEIPHIIQRTLLSIGCKGTIITKTVNEDLEPHVGNIDRIKLIEFDDVNDAYEWFAQIKMLPEGTAVINRNNVRLNHTLYTWDRPQLHSTFKDSNPQLLQLFKLSMSIFSRPLNIQNLVSYLMLPMSPIPGALRRRLARLLISQGGFGEKKVREKGVERDEWEEIIESFEFLNKESKPTSQARTKKMPFLAPIRADFSRGIEKNDVIAYIDMLKTWATGHFADNELPQARKDQLHQLITFLDSLNIALQPLPNKVSYSDLEKLILQIYRPMNYSLQAAENGSYNVISNIRSLAVKAQTIIWLDCQEDDKEMDPYDFLSSTERNYLKSKGCIVPDFAKHLQICRSECARIINACDCVILIRSRFDGTTRLGEHPLIAEVRYAFKQAGIKLRASKPNDLFEMIETTSTHDVIDRFSPVKALELGDIDYQGRKESNTSLDTLINFPFNYLMQYVARLPMPDEEQLMSLYVITGLVAHHFFEHVIEDANKEIEQMRKLTCDEFDQRLEDAIDSTGLLLRLEESASTLIEFKVQLKRSMLALIDIMKENQWSPVGCEVNFPEENKHLKLRTIGDFGARIDFLLTQADGRFVIIDFKWSYSKKYSEYLENNTAIQLELYRQAVLATYPGKNVAGVAYYLMPKNQLLTTDFEEIPKSRLIKRIDSNSSSDLFEQIQNSYEFRMEELKRGHIEEAEMLDVFTDTDNYYSMTSDNNLCPLDVEEKYEGRGANKSVVSAIKKSEKVFKNTKKKTFDEKDSEPSEVATSHPILKGRLK